MNHLSLFSGIGGLDLAAEWAGMTTVAFCERDSFCQKVLAKHWPNIPIFDDIHTLTADALSERGIDQIDIVSGGFPCQPFSLAGERRGHEDTRYLWPQMLRIITEARPRWVVGENVTGIIDLALDDVLASLEAKGYETQAIVFPACAVGAQHNRQRVFIIAYANCIGMEGCSAEPLLRERNIPSRQVSIPVPTIPERFNTFESRLCRSVHGIPYGVDRLRALGNAVVPQQAYPIFAAIAAIESSEQLFTLNHDQTNP